MTELEPQGLSQHPLSKAFPPMTTEAMQALVGDIKSQGLKEAIITHDGKILDGWHRYLACQFAGVEPRFRAYQGTDPVAYVRSKNLCRRDMTPLLTRDTETYLGALA